ncbi:MAG: hypothetical protein Athens101410_114 [Parcubacteria group bacterium Athens1014_10]|nr:MAG: hypothetical protein Athens101410_114 [Parcubacteria group bacterium Athens1014_10]TSD05917.1 MAG: hypothetical protein Athens071412_199 [Parcubacteria group bacterium Athens0714_12]
MPTNLKILFVVLLIIIFLIGGFFIYKNNLAPAEKESNNINQEAENKIAEEVIIPIADEETKLKLELQSLASFFAESYGNYSNQNNYENIIDLKPFMTQAMRKWADDFIKQALRKQSAEQPYEKFSAKFLNSEIESFNSNQALIKVNCQRQESSDSPSDNKIYYQEAKITFLKENGDWKVNEIKWE